MFDFHQVNNRDPYVYKTTDYGRTWKPIVNGIPKTMLSYAHAIKEDPVRQGLLYLGTEGGMFVSFDDGEHWQPLQMNLPHAPVYGITVQEQFNDLVIATYGRGFWILDDLSPLQQITDAVRNSSAHLFTARPAYRFVSPEAPVSPAIDMTAGQNPAYGAAINYWLKPGTSGDVKVQISDSGGQLIRTLDGTGEPGLNRVHWDLKTEPSTEIRLRTKPLYAPEFPLNEEGWRPAPEGGRISVLVPPGTYTVKLMAGGQTFTQPLTVRKDPNAGGSDATLKAQIDLLHELRGELDSAAKMVNTVEMIRSQLYSLERVTAGGRDAAAVKEAVDALEQKLLHVEDRLIQRKFTGQGQDTTRWPAQLVSKITYLANGVDGSDDAPTSQAKEVESDYRKELSALQQELDGVLEKDLTNFNRLLRDRGIQGVIK